MESKKRKNHSPLDIKSESYSCYIIFEVFIRKFRHFCDFNNSNLVMPFFSECLAENILSFKKSDILDTNRGINKPLFRGILLERLGLDSDLIGKKGYSFDSRSVIDQNWLWVERTITSCQLWQSDNVKDILKRLVSNFNGDSWKCAASYRLVYRLLMISLWFSHSKYIKK